MDKGFFNFRYCSVKRHTIAAAKKRPWKKRMSWVVHNFMKGHNYHHRRIFFWHYYKFWNNAWKILLINSSHRSTHESNALNAAMIDKNKTTLVTWYSLNFFASTIESTEKTILVDLLKNEAISYQTVFKKVPFWKNIYSKKIWSCA